MQQVQFKPGQWLVRQWSVTFDNDIDFALFHSHFDREQFTYSALFRFDSSGTQVLWEFDTSDGDNQIKYIENDARMIKYNWRPATVNEVAKFCSLILTNKYRTK